jgi:hypothetical protein
VRFGCLVRYGPHDPIAADIARHAPVVQTIVSHVQVAAPDGTHRTRT